MAASKKRKRLKKPAAEMTTEEAMQALFPKKVRDKLKEGVDDPPKTPKSS